MTIKDYDFMYQLYKNHQISKQRWQEYCTACLEELMKQNQEVLERLKNK